MHPEILKERPGICPECGMNLVPVSAKATAGKPTKDMDKHAGHKTSFFLNKFWVAAVLTVPIFFYSEMAITVFKIEAPTIPGSQYVLLVLGSVVFFYCALVAVFMSASTVIVALNAVLLKNKKI